MTQRADVAPANTSSFQEAGRIKGKGDKGERKSPAILQGDFLKVSVPHSYFISLGLKVIMSLLLAT